jgi:two-component system response regulator
MTAEVDILLIEDNPNDVELTLHALRRHHPDLQVEVLRDGAEAIDRIFCTGAFSARNILNRPRFILLDLKLPKVSGVEVLRQIKSDERTRGIPVVALTTSTESRDISVSYGLGVNSYIAKPVDFEEFSEAVRQIGNYWLSLNCSSEC